MSNFPLLLGSALVAFGPFLSLFFLLMYPKAQLVIIVTTSAFFFLVSALGASFVWWLFTLIHLDSVVSVLLPGVLSQFLFRCSFVALYHKVEKVIRLSIEQEDARGQTGTQDDLEEYDENWTAAAKLRLQLNDASCGVAAGVGFGGMHAIMLFGTLLASQSGNAGILYQESCPSIPSLAQSAVYALCFSIMDIFWMLLTFFGMRRRLLYHRGREFEDNIRGFGSYFGNSRSGGNLALMFVLLSHLASSVVTVSSAFDKGCLVSLPSLVGITFFTAYAFWAGTARIYMPPENSDQSISRTASRLSASESPARNRID
jgi:gamma-secretase subunit APH-1